jgi:parallel beta-helix repeat protein
MSSRGASRRAARAASALSRCVTEALESRLMLTGTHEAVLLGTLASSLQSGAASGLSGFDSRLDDATELGRSLPLIGNGLSSFDPGATLNSVLSRVSSGYTTLSQLSSAVEGAAGLADGAAVAASRDLPDDVELDLQFSVSSTKTVPISANFGGAFSASGSVTLKTTFSENLTVGAYWDATTSLPVFYVSANNTNIQVGTTVTSATLAASAHLGFIDLNVSGVSAVFSPTFTFALTDPSAGDASSAAGRITAAELVSTPLSSLVTATLGQAAPTSLTATISTSLVPAATSVTFTWADINDPTNVSSNLSTDSALASLNNLQNISPATITAGIDALVSDLSGAATGTVTGNALATKLPLINKSIDDIVNFPQFFKTYLSSFTDATTDSSGASVEPFSTANGLMTLLKSIPGVGASNITSQVTGSELMYMLNIPETINASYPLALSLGSALNLSATGTVNLSLATDTKLTFGIDASTGTFFIVDPTQPAFAANASLTATINGGASLGFIAVNISGGSVSTNAAASVTLVDPNSDGVITLSELTSTGLSSLVNLSLTGSASASLPLSTTVPGISPVTLSLSWPDVTDPSTLNINTSALTQFLDFNNLSFATVLGYLKNLPNFLNTFAGSSGIGKDVAFIGSSLGTAISIGTTLNNDLNSLGTINTVQDLQTALLAKLGASNFGLGITGQELDFTLKMNQTYSGNANWSFGGSFAGGLVSLQSSGTVPLKASFNAQLQFGLDLSQLENATSPADVPNAFFIVSGSASNLSTGSNLSAQFNVQGTGINATATIAFAQVGIANGTVTVAGTDGGGNIVPTSNATASLVLGDGTAGDKVNLTSLLSNIGSDISLNFNGAAQAVLPLTGLPSTNVSNPTVTVNWTNLSDPTTLNFTTNFDVSDLNPLANFNTSNFFAGINSLISLVQKWDTQPLFQTKIPFINEPISSIIDGAAYVTNVLQKIESAAGSATTPSALESTILNSPAAAGFSSALAEIDTVAGKDNPANSTFDYVLKFHDNLVNSPFPFQWGDSLFNLSGGITVNASFTTDIEFGFDKTDGFYIVGSNDANNPMVGLSGSVTGTFDRIGGMFGPLQYGVSNGSAALTFALGLNLSESSNNGSKIPATDIVTDIASILHPVLSGSGNLTLPIGLRLGSGTSGPAVTTTFTATWNPNQQNQLGFGSNDSSDPADGFSALNYDLGEFINGIIDPVLSDIQEYNPIPQSVLDTLNTNIPVINKTAGQILGDYLNNPGLKLLFGIAGVIADAPPASAPAGSVDVSPYFPVNSQPTGTDAGSSSGGASNSSGGLFSNFAKTLKSDFYLDVPILDDPSGTIIKLLTGKDVDLVTFDPGNISLTQSYQLPQIAIPIASLGVASVNAFISGSLTASLFANIDLGLSTRGIHGEEIGGGGVNLLDGFYIDDSAQYQAGVTLAANLQIGGEVSIFGYNAVQLYGQFSSFGTFGVHVNDVGYNKATGLPEGIAGYDGTPAGDNKVYLDEISYIAGNYGPLCAIMPEGELGLGVSLVAKVNLLFTSITVLNVGSTIILVDYNYPCVPVLANLASIQGNQLVMNTDSTTAGKNISASIEDDPNTGMPSAVRLIESNSSTINYQDFTFAQLSAAGVHTLVLQGSNGDDTFKIDPNITKQGPIQNLVFNTGNGNDAVDLTNLTAANSALTGVTINAGNGNDTIKGTYALEDIFLGNGGNTLFTGTGAALVTESAGTDTITGGDGNVTVNGGTGTESILLGNGNNVVNAGSGSDTIGVGNGNNQIFAGSGGETIQLGDGKNYVAAGTGTDSITAGNGDNKIYGDSGGSTISAGSGQDIIIGGSGNDSITAGGGNDFINPGTGTNIVDGGTGNTLLEISANANQQLFTGSVVVTGLGTTTFTHIASVALTGGAGNNSFDVSGWFGAPVQITGGGGTDTIVSTADTDYTLGDGSLTRSDGTKFSLSGISAANLGGGPSDNKFDLTYWHGTAIIAGGGGVDELLAGNVIGGVLTNTTLTRAGAGTLNFSGITRAQLTTSIAGSTSIDATGFTGDLALYGQGGGNTLTGGTGSDYIVGGAGSNTLIGKGTTDNQIIGGSGSGDSITGGPGTNLLVGSNGGGDTITAGAGSTRVYTPGGNDTVHAETGNTVVYAGGTGDSVLTGSSSTDQVVHAGDAGTLSSDFTAPAEDQWDFPQSPLSATNTLPTGGDSQGQWAEDGASASSGGISSSVASAVDPATVSTGSGSSAVTYVAWADNRSGIYEIYVAKHVNGVWSELAGSAHGLGISGLLSGRRPSITLDSSGNPIVAWTQINGTSTNIEVAHYDPTANSGAGGWTAYGASLNVTTTGHADNAKIVVTSTGPVVAWLDTTSGNANVYVAAFSGSTWSALGSGATTGTGVSASATAVSGLTLATDGTKVAIGWTQTVNANSAIYLKQYSGSTWSAVDGSASGNGLSGANAASTPSAVYFSGTLFVAYASLISGTTNVQVATAGASAWTNVTVDTPTSAGANQVSRSAASAPTLAVNGGNMDLVWIEDRLSATPDQAVAIYANRYVGGSFVRQLPGDASDDGILRRSTSLSSSSALSLAVDSAGHPFVVWGDTSSGSSQIYGLGDTLDVTKIIYVNDALTANDSYSTAAGASTNNGLTPATPLDSLQAALNLTGLGAGTVILVDGGAYSSNVIVSSSDNGVMIIGSPGAPTTVSGTVTLSSAQNVTLEGLRLTMGMAVNGGNHIELVDDSGGTPAQVAANTGGRITLTGSTNVTLEHDAFAGLTLAGTTNTTVVNSTFTGTGIAVTLTASGLIASGNTLAAITLGALAQGSISNNNIVGGGLSILQAFTGPIQNNLIHGAIVGVTYAAPALLSNNRIYGNNIGVVDTVNSPTAGLGFVAGSLPNQIFSNGVGVNLTGSMQDQHIAFNTIGVTGSGTLGGSSLDTSNLVEANNVGSQFNGTVQYTRFDRNLQSIAVESGQLIDHDVFYNNTGINLETLGASDVRIINDTFYSSTGTNVQVDSSSSNVQVLNSILWTAGGYDLYLDSSSLTGFFSDYNDLYSTGTGKLVHYQLDFTDILDWQDDVNLYDLHSIGTEAVNPTGAQPKFVDLSLGDFRVLTAAAGVRSSSPTIGTGDPAIDLGVPAGDSNLLTDPSFESGLTGWTASAGAGTLSSSPSAFDGSSYFYAGAVGSGFVQQTVTLPVGTNQVVDFGGRIRSASESVADQGKLTLTFLDTNHNPIGTADVLSASNVSNRWELVGDRVEVPAGAIYAVYRFDALRETGSTDDSYLDGAFLYVMPNTVDVSMGGYGGTSTEASAPAAEHIQLRSPDLYVNWELNTAHQIVWSTFGNTGNLPVEIDLYHDVSGVSTFFKQIVASTADTGSYTWIPSSTSGLTYGMYGLRIQVSIAGNTAIHDRSSETFTIPENGTTFYVNDRSTTGDEYSTAAGNNRATGKLPGAPLPLLTTLLREYSLNATSTVYVDSGTYNDFAPIELSGNPAIGSGQGVTIIGAVNHATTINALGFTSPAVFDMNAASFVTISHIAVTGGDYGFWVRNGSTNFSGSYLTANGNRYGGLRLELDAANSSLDHIIADNNGASAGQYGDGIYVGGPIIKVTNSTASNNAADGFDLLNAGNAVLTGDVGNNNLRYGLEIRENTSGDTATVGSTNLSAGLGNQFAGNALYGIVASGNGVSGVLVAGNTVSGQTATGDAGITGASGTVVTENVVFNNYDGIRNSQGTTTSNLVYGNSDIGIDDNNSGTVSGNVVYNNGIGIRGLYLLNGGTIANNLLYGNTQQGILLSGGNGVQVNNNTVYQAAGDALQINSTGYYQASGIRAENNIFWAIGTAFAIAVDQSSEGGLHTDYNDLYATAGGQVGMWENVARPGLQSWQFASQQDADSVSADPLFVNAAGGDYHVQSTTGSYHNGSLSPVLGGNNLPAAAVGTLTADSQESPVIDRGDASFSFSSEPAPNGAFINIGAFGNTAQASESPASYVLVLSPQAGAVVVESGTTTITWRSQDTTGTVNIDLLLSGSVVLSIASAVSNNGSYSWAVPTSITAGSNYTIRITRNTTTAVGSSGAFTISGQTHIYYVNDGTVTTGDLTTAPGSDANSGLDPAHPKASIQGVLSAYTLGAGDTIEVDRGIYDTSTNIVIAAANAGIKIEGYQTASNGSQWGSNVNASSPTYYNTLSGSQAGVLGAGDTSTSFNGSGGVTLPTSVLSFSSGFSFEAWINPAAQTNGTLFDFVQYTSSAENQVLHRLTLDRGSFGADLYLSGTFGTVDLASVLITNTWQFIAVTITSTGSVTFYRDGQSIGTGTITAPTTLGASNAVCRLAGNVSSTNAYSGLMELAAFYSHVETPAEQLGRYSLILTTPIFDRQNKTAGADVFDVQANNVTIDHLTLMVADIGVNVSGGLSGLVISNDVITEMTDEGIYLNSGDNGAFIQNNTIGPVAGYYGGGVYVISSDVTISGNTIFGCVTGVYLQTGMNSLITGNTVYGNQYGINANYATITQNIVHDNPNYGINAAVGTTVTGNTVYNNIGGNFGAGILLQQGFVSGNVAYGNGWGIYGANGLGTANDNLVYGNINGGIEIDNGTYFGGNVVEGNSGYGVYVNVSPYGGGSYGSLTNNVIYGNTAGGIQVYTSQGFLIQNNTVYQTTGDALNITGAGPGLVVKDNILAATNGADMEITAAAQAGVSSDYNDLWVTGSGVLGKANGISYSALTDFTNATGLDTDSLSADPLFVSIASSDFHEQSTFGSFHGGSLAPVLNTTTGLPIPVTATLTADANQSPAIDAGNPTDAFNLEPSPNGGYDNLGAYGDTAQASLSPTTYLTVLNPHIGQTIATGQIYPVVWRTQDHAGNVEIDLVQSNGTVVEVIAAAATNSGTFAWAVPTALSSGTYTVRVTRSDGAGSGSGSAFTIAGSTGIYYVNDTTVVAGDWTTAPGNNANSGLDPAHPKASISAILAAYQLMPGNIIMVDDGTYSLTANITLTAADSGIIIEGFTGTSPLLNRGNTTVGSFGFGLSGATNVTIENFEITNSYEAVVAGDNTASTGLTVSNLNIHNFYQAGIYIGPGNGGATLTGNSIHDGVGSNTGYYGIQDTSSQATIANNTIFDCSTDCIYMQTGANSTISGNTVYNSSTGIISDHATITGNIVHDNANSGISVSYSTITGNTVYNNAGTGNQAGILLSYSTATNNIVYGNYNGIDAETSAFAINNRVYNNSNDGIITQYGTATGNDVYSNGVGIYATGTVVLTDNLIYANTTFGVELYAAYTASVTFNTIYQPTGDAVQTSSIYYVVATSLVLADNIIWVAGGRAYLVADAQVAAFSSNYNDIYVTGTGEIANFAGQDFATLSAWTTELGFDTNSISADPMFVSPAGADGALGYTGGVDHGTDDNFRIKSGAPTIDAADPAQPYSNEPAPNGGRANLGYTGNTSLATPSAAQTIQVISPTGRLQAGKTVAITWNSNGLTDPSPNNAYTSAVVSQNPLVYLKLDETSGTTAVDSSGNGLNGVYANGPTLGVTSVFGPGQGSAVGFNGSTDAVTVSSPTLDLTRTVTMSAWIKPTSLAQTWQPIFYKGLGDYMHRTYSVFLNTAGFLLLDSFDGTSERTLATANGSIPVNQWTHIVVVMDRTNATAAIYLNGVLAASAAPNTFPAVAAQDSINQPLYIGYSPENSPQFGQFLYTGYIDEAAVFAKALSATDVAAQYQSTRGSFHVDLLNSSNAVVQSIATGVHGSAYTGWTVPASVAEGTYTIRVTSDLSGAVAGVSQPFTIVPATHDYYVNDGSLTGDATDTAVGNNVNNGESASTPMFSVEAVINTYHPGAGDTIHIENGTYRLYHNITLSAANSGLIFQGPTAAGTTATLNRASTSDYLFTFGDGTHNVTIDHLSLTGGDTAVYGGDQTTGVSNITVSNDIIYGNVDMGIYVGNADTGWIITGNLIHDNNGAGNYAGVRVYSGSATISNNSIYNETNYGVYLQGLTASASVISGNNVYACGNGIYVYYNTTITGNLVHDNTTVGIYAGSGVLAIGNTVWRQTAASATGIELSGGEARGNIVYGNYNGIWMRGQDTVDDNRIYSNTNYGLYTQGGNGKIFNNLIYDNSNGGIYVLSTYAGIAITNNTVYQPVNDAINISASTGDVVKNNVLWVEAGYDLDIASNSQSGFVSDYNDLHHGAGSNAKTGFWNSTGDTQLSDWQTASANDAHSIAGDPLFVSISGADSVQGYNPTANNGNGYDGGADDNFFLAANSPAIGAAYAPAAPATDLLGQTRTSPVDMGAYAFTGSNSDTTPPTITGTTPSAINSSGQAINISTIGITFSEPVNPIDALAVTVYDLRSAGPDGVFDTSDDVLYAVTPVYTPGSTVVTLNVVAGTLPAGNYRLRVVGGDIHDLAGNALAATYSRTFGVSAAGPVTLPSQAQYIRLDGVNIDVFNNSTGTGTPILQVALASITVLTVNQPAGAAAFVVDLSAGIPLPAGGFNFTGNSTGGLTVIGSVTLNDTIVFSNSQMTVDGITLNLVTPGTVRFRPGTGSDSVTVNSGTLDLAATTGSSVTVASFSSISVAAGATLKAESPATQSGRYLLVINALNIAGATNAWTGRLDLGSNDLDLPGASLATVVNQINSGYSNDTWTGTGISSTSLAGDSTHLHALGAIVNNDGNGHTLYGITRRKRCSGQIHLLG